MHVPGRLWKLARTSLVKERMEKSRKELRTKKATTKRLEQNTFYKVHGEAPKKERT